MSLWHKNYNIIEFSHWSFKVICQCTSKIVGDLGFSIWLTYIRLSSDVLSLLLQNLWVILTFWRVVSGVVFYLEEPDFNKLLCSFGLWSTTCCRCLGLASCLTDWVSVYLERSCRAWSLTSISKQGRCLWQARYALTSRNCWWACIACIASSLIEMRFILETLYCCTWWDCNWVSFTNYPFYLFLSGCVPVCLPVRIGTQGPWPVELDRSVRISAYQLTCNQAGKQARRNAYLNPAYSGGTQGRLNLKRSSEQ